ncbi:hypothetical protein [Bacteroides faecium]|uniref:Uncharacterized protein n=1 Tax=Bacteroides faecium TaxID=2715212 RepID=A0A6H0KT13_9BACE|nr:hypothetical protein [Bacteroides faecium]QIU96550.1 hypothetical protein BacF7301_21400 [Bacteroides faecium]
MKKYLVTYADESFKDAGERLMVTSRQLGVFDDCLLYSREDLTSEMRNSPIMRFPRGGGYWAWKSDVILQMLDKINWGDYVVYVDAGCYVYHSGEWGKMWRSLKGYDLILFRIPNQIKRWIKRDTLNYFGVSLNNNLMEQYLVAGGVIFFKKTPFTISFFESWRKLALEKYYLFVDSKRVDEYPDFIEHRHDQAILSLLFYCTFKKSNRIKVFWENFEVRGARQCIYAARSKKKFQEKKTKALHKQAYHYLFKYPMCSLAKFLFQR